MKKLSTLQLALSYVGAFLGVGFISGQELWQFFACFGTVGFLGFFLSSVIFFIVTYALLQLVSRSGQEEVGKLMTPKGHPGLASVVNIMQIGLLFGVSVIMTAGAASLASQLLGVPKWIAAAVFTLIVMLAAMTGMQGLVAVFSFIVPVTTVCAVILGGAAIIRSGFTFSPAVGGVADLVPHWAAGFPTYAAYNLMGTVSVMVPFARAIPDKRTLRWGLGLGSGILVLLAWSIISAIAVSPEAAASELPMAMIAAQLHPAFEAGYGALMGLGMFTCSLATVTAAVNQISVKWKKAAAKPRRVAAAMLSASYLLSLVGFGDLIGVIYPVFGYISIPFLCFIVINRLKLSRSPGK